MSNIEKFPEGNYGVTFLSFNEGERVYSEGCEVPNLRAFHNQDDTVILVYDRRFATQNISVKEAKMFVSFLANCLAVASGFTHFSSDARRRDRFTVKSIDIGGTNHE